MRTYKQIAPRSSTAAATAAATQSSRHRLVRTSAAVGVDQWNGPPRIQRSLAVYLLEVTYTQQTDGSKAAAAHLQQQQQHRCTPTMQRRI